MSENYCNSCTHSIPGYSVCMYACMCAWGGGGVQVHMHA